MSETLKLSAIKAFIFDMDGVITNTMPDHFRTWKKVLNDENIHVSRYDIYKREGQKGLQSIYEICAEYRHPCPPAKARRLLKKKEALFKKTNRVRFIPGARRLIRSLHAQGKILALVTGTSRPECLKILPPDLFKLFKVVVTGSDVRCGKPDPEPYLLALKKLQLQARYAVVVENAPFGIHSAKRAGFKCLALETSLPREYLKEADEIYDSIEVLRKHVFAT